MSDLVENNWFLLTVSAFDFLQYVILVETDKIWFHTDMQFQRGGVF